VKFDERNFVFNLSSNTVLGSQSTPCPLLTGVDRLAADNGLAIVTVFIIIKDWI
jgi:hypothetical protein